MKCSLVLLLLLQQLLSGCLARGLFSNYTLGIDSAELVTNPCKDVRLAGFICVDCSTLGFCSNVNGEWQTVQMATCQAERGFYCSDEETYGCTWQPRCKVPVRGKFYCQGEGIFPDPYDCRSYHECSAQHIDTPRQCTNGAGYSLAAKSCSLPRDHDQCTQKQYTCSRLGQTGVWAADSSYYYVCQQETSGTDSVFYPLMLKCNDGYTFNGHTCVPPSSKRSLAHQPLTSNICEEGELYPAAHAHAYFACHAGKLVFQACPLNALFDVTTKACIRDPEHCEEGATYAAKSKYGFNYCHQGELLYQRCPLRYYFDQDLSACRRIEETCQNFDLSPAEDTGFYVCLGGRLNYNACPQGTIFYDEVHNVCIINPKF